MSWDVSLSNGGYIVSVPKFSEGGMRAIGGDTIASLNITYNYSSLFHQALDRAKGLDWLHGKQAGICIRRLQEVVIKLGIVQADDYWAATEGNVGHALNILLGWAYMYPDAIFHVD